MNYGHVTIMFLTVNAERYRGIPSSVARQSDFGDIKVMISIQNEYALHLLLKYCATRSSKSVIVYF